MYKKSSQNVQQLHVRFIAILFQQSLIFGKLNINHHSFIHGNPWKCIQTTRSFLLFRLCSTSSNTSLCVPCSHFILSFKISSTWPIWGLFDYSSLSTATKLHFCILEISMGSIPSSSSLKILFSVVFTFIFYLRGISVFFLLSCICQDTPAKKGI